MRNSYVSSFLTEDSILGFCLQKAGEWTGSGWYVQVNMHGQPQGSDCYLGAFTTKQAADRAGEVMIEKQLSIIKALQDSTKTAH